MNPFKVGDIVRRTNWVISTKVYTVTSINGKFVRVQGQESGIHYDYWELAEEQHFDKELFTL